MPNEYQQVIGRIASQDGLYTPFVLPFSVSNYATNNTFFMPVMPEMEEMASAVELLVSLKLPFKWYFRKIYLKPIINSKDANTTLRLIKNGVNSSTLLTVGAGSTAEQSTQDAAVANDLSRITFDPNTPFSLSVNTSLSTAGNIYFVGYLVGIKDLSNAI